MIRAMPALIHTCYRIATSTARSPSTPPSDSRSAAGCRSATRRSTSSWACPGTAIGLELTYNFGVDGYELGTGYNHIAITAPDLDETLASLGEQGIEPEKPPYSVREGGSRICFVRDPDGYRIELIEGDR
jgi:lactoylglutathione lyase